MLKKLLRALATKQQLIERMDELTARVDVLQQVTEKVDEEWESWYEKYRTLYARLSKRAKQVEEAEGRDPGGLDGRRPEGESYAERLARARSRYPTFGG